MRRSDANHTVPSKPFGEQLPSLRARIHDQSRGTGPPAARSAGADDLSASSPPVGGSAAVYTAVACACCGAFLFGYHLGIVNGPLQTIAADLGFLDNVPLQGLVVSISLAGAAVGSLSGSILADVLGRARAFAADAAPLLLGAVLSATATSPSTMLAGRFLVGLGIGLSSALVPLYITEVAPTAQRGALGTINQFMICVGILAALLVNVVLPFTEWRMMFWLSAIPAGLLAVGMATQPESPSYLLEKGRRVEAEASAKRLWGKRFRTELYGAMGETAGADVASVGQGVKAAGMGMEAAGAAVKAADAAERGMVKQDVAKQGVSWTEMLSGSNGRLVAIACALFLFQQFSGINAIVYFSSSVFRQAGVGSEALASAAVGGVNVLGTLVAASLMDRSGRKQLLSLSLGGQGLSMLLMAIAFATPSLQAYAAPISLGFTLLYVLMFALGSGPVPGILCAEILPTSIRGRGVSIALVTHWVCNFMLGQLFLQAVASFGISAVYCFFAAVCAAGVVFIQTVVVETKGRSPEEIAKLMQ